MCSPRQVSVESRNNNIIYYIPWSSRVITISQRVGSVIKRSPGGQHMRRHATLLLLLLIDNASAFPSPCGRPALQARVKRSKPTLLSSQVDVLDDALAAAEGQSRMYEHALLLTIGLGLFGSSAIVILPPILMDATIAAEPLFDSSTLVAGSSATFAAWAVGALLTGGLSDRFGRKSVVVASGLIGSAGMLAGAFAPNALALVAGRALGGLALGGTVGQGYLLIRECLSQARSSALSTKLNVLWVGVVAMIATLHSCGLPWRVEQAVLGGFFAASTLLVAALAVESPTYLAASGRRDEAVAAISRIGRISRADARLRPLLPALDAWSKEDARSADGGATTREIPTPARTAHELLGPGMRRSTLSVCLAYASLGFGYYAISFSAGTPAPRVQPSACTATILPPLPSPLLPPPLLTPLPHSFCSPTCAGALSDAVLFNFVCLAALDLPGYVLAAKLAAWRGVRSSAALGLGVTSALLVATGALAACGTGSALTTAAAFAAKLTAATTFCLLYDLPSESFPLHVRGSATGLAQSSARAGGLLAPLAISFLPMSIATVVMGAPLALAAAALSTWRLD